MAKRIVKAVNTSKPVQQAAAAANAVPAGGSGEQTLQAYAEALGTAMGHVRGQIDGWSKQRSHMVDQLSTMVADAQQLLADLGHATTESVSRLRGKKKTTYKKPASNPAGGIKPLKPKARKSSARVMEMAADKPRPAPRVNRKILN